MRSENIDGRINDDDLLQYVEQLPSHAVRDELERVGKRKRQLRRSLRYNGFKRRFRLGADAATTRAGAVVVVSIICTGLATVLSHLVQLSSSHITTIALLVALVAALVCSDCLFWPDDVTLDMVIRNHGRDYLHALGLARHLKARNADIANQAPATSRVSSAPRPRYVEDPWISPEQSGRSGWPGPRIRPVVAETTSVRPGLFEQVITIRDRIVRPHWESMSGIPFERFLVSVFLRHGYHVEMTKASGDQGVDLVLSKRNYRIAIQAKGYPSGNSVGNKAVQEAHTGMAYYKCNACAVITNSIFTKGARDLAGGVGCVLIDGSALGNLVAGRLKL